MRLRLRLKYNSGINAPTYALHTVAGVSPASWDVSGDSTFQPGMWVHQQFASDSGFTTALVDYYTEVNGSDWEATSETIGGGASVGIAGASQAFIQPSSTYFTRCRFETSPGDITYNLVSTWSNTITDTIITSSAVLNTVTGVNKNANVTVSGSPALTFSGAAGNDKTTVRSTIEQASSKAQFELTIISGATTNFGVGLDDGTADLSTLVTPGYSNSSGIFVEFTAGTEIYVDYNARGTQVVLATSSAGVCQNGDVFTIIFDKSAHTCEVWRTRSGSTVQIGSTATSMPTLTHYYATAGTINNTMSGTINFGGSTYAKTPSGGVAAIWA